ncbi:uncharacterized protein AMSG_04382 [Thecamonas trahens ATCC 50062]|uniref:Ras-GAP domain-containing protein n=1 Tax=Thecamonas trahens ATCC 50062 TaxID=461836 RepID=A0A0L0DA37_THETB|nr:hypothetical protein AMSG_04382 [Thecamonas trahens ATCC 50062]KNC48153.1 hypothetical protein AMSG_04382 [Thecamonas trahens ATCC 50062]|eukprot:XP_013758723.1 hypothetical protein AMSG_04382 [Thecamonas trahens ATCC 50062]
MAGELCVRVHTLLTKESLRVKSAQATLAALRRDMAGRCESLARLTATDRVLRKRVEALVNNKIHITDVVGSAASVELVTSLAVFGSKQVDVTEFVSLLRTAPEYIEDALLSRELSMAELDALTDAVVLGLFHNHHGPVEEYALVRLTGAILKRTLAMSASLADFLHPRSIGVRMLVLYCKSYSFEFQSFLVAVLREPLVSLLADPELDLELVPALLLARMPESEKQCQYLANVKADATLPSHPNMIKVLTGRFDRMVDAVSSVLNAIRNHIVLLPTGFRAVLSSVAASAVEALELDNPEAAQTKLVTEILFRRLIVPAIITPEPYGVLADTVVPQLARRNLTLLAKAVQGAISGEPKRLFRESYLAPLVDRLAAINADDIVTAVMSPLPLATLTLAIPAVQPGLGRTAWATLSMPQILALVACMAKTAPILDARTGNRDSKMSVFLARLKKLDAEKLAAAAPSNAVYLLPLNDAATAAVWAPGDERPDRPWAVAIQPEDAVVAASAPAVAAATAADPPALAIAKTTLRSVFTELPLRAHDMLLDSVPAVLEAAAHRLAHRSPRMVVLLDKAQASLAALPESYAAAGYVPVLVSLIADLEARRTYSSYLEGVHEELVLAYAALEADIDRVHDAIKLSLNYQQLAAVQHVLDAHAAEVETFKAKFSSLIRNDERSDAVVKLMDLLEARLAESGVAAGSAASADGASSSSAGTSADDAGPVSLLSPRSDVWGRVLTESKLPTQLFEELDARTTLEMAVMSQIYSVVFYPRPHGWAKGNKTVDVSMAWLKRLSNIEPSDEALQIAPEFLDQAPWSAAQEAIGTLNLHKSPRSKLAVIRNTAVLLMELLASSGSLNREFIETYYRPRAAESTQDTYWFTQFASALALIKSLAEQR